MRLRMGAKVALVFTGTLVGASTVHLLIALGVMARETREMGTTLVTMGLLQAQHAAQVDALDPETLRARYGWLPGYAAALFDGEGRLLARSRQDVEVPARLEHAHRERAAADPDEPVFIEHFALGSDAEAIMAVPGEASSGRYVGLFDRWSKTRLNPSVQLGVFGGFAANVAIGLLAAALVARRIRRGLGHAQSVVRRMADGELDIRLPQDRKDEVGALARDFNRMASQLQAHLTQLEREQEGRRRSFADWSHEISTPLTSVLGYLESLQDEEVAEDTAMRQRYLQIALDQAEALQTLTEDLRTLSQLDVGDLVLYREERDLSEIAEGEIEALRPLAAQRGVEVELSAPDAPVVVHADPRRLGQVVRNLLKNAIAHSPAHGRVSVRVQTVQQGACLEIEDRGPGIAPEHLAHLGEPFYRPDPSRARGTGGRGLGLAIARGIVESHGGELCVDSKVGEGTSVRVALGAA